MNASTMQRAGWLMYGSRKPGEEAGKAWRVTRVYAYEPGASKGDAQSKDVTAWTDLSPGRLVRLLSIRNKYDERPRLTATGRARMEALVREREEERQRRLEASDALDATETSSSTPAELSELGELVGLLSSERATGYSTWIAVGFALCNETGKSEGGQGLFKAFSRKAGAGVYDEAGCERAWRTLTPRITARARLGRRTPLDRLWVTVPEGWRCGGAYVECPYTSLWSLDGTAVAAGGTNPAEARTRGRAAAPLRQPRICCKPVRMSHLHLHLNLNRLTHRQRNRHHCWPHSLCQA